MKTKRHFLPYLLVLLCTVCLAGGIYFYHGRTNNVMTYNAFAAAAEQGKVEAVTFHNSENYMEVTLHNQNQTYKAPHPQSQDFMDFLIEHNIHVTYADTSGGSPAAQILLLFAAAGGVLFFHRKHQRSGFAKDANAGEAVNVTFDDIAGNSEAKAMVQDIITFIRTPEQYTRIGAQMPHGVLFYGPPGTGKTLMAKAVAGEAGVPFYACSGSDFIQMYVGVGASRIRELFKAARSSEKAVIFIDEIDAIGKRRTSQPDGSNDERDQTLNALLTEMSGFSDREGIVVIAATNRMDTLDEALTRPGRFDRLVEIALPDVCAREQILGLHARSKNLSDAVNLHDLAVSTVSFSGAMLAHLLNEAAIFAANEQKLYIGQNHIDQAFYTVLAGAAKDDTSYISHQDRQITAYHEAGHALATRLLLPDSYISRVTIIPSTRGAGGFSLSIPQDSMYLTKQALLANIQVLLAGRASESLHFGPDAVTTGASNDIEKASRLILDYINHYGMDDDFGLFNSDQMASPPSDHLATLCRQRLNELYENTLSLLGDNKEHLERITNELLKKETLNADDIESLCSF